MEKLNSGVCASFEALTRLWPGWPGWPVWPGWPGSDQAFFYTHPGGPWHAFFLPGTHFLSFMCPVGTHGIFPPYMPISHNCCFYRKKWYFWWDIFISPFYLSLILMVFNMIVIIKMKINVKWVMPVAASLSREPQTFRTMDRWSRTNKSLRKVLDMIKQIFAVF